MASTYHRWGVNTSKRFAGVVVAVSDYNELVEDLSIEDRRFLAGVIFARGKLYIGRSKRGTGFRYSPMLTVELSMQLPTHFEWLFDGPYERHYYGNVVLRYALQDQEKIAALLGVLHSQFPSQMRERVGQMIVFCRSDDSQRVKAYENFVAA